MIRYRLLCKAGHEFEAWLRNSGAYNRQVRRGEIVCPDCGTAEVEKAIMAPGISTGSRGAEAPEKQPEQAAQPKTTAVANSTAIANPEALQRAQVQKELLALMRHLRREVEKNAEYVGPDFASEARKIHYEEAPKRGIYGEASLQDAKALREEGIDCMPLPPLPEDHN